MSVGSAVSIAFTRSNSPVLIASMKAALLEVISGMHRSYPGCGAAAGLKARTTPEYASAGLKARTTPVSATAGLKARTTPDSATAGLKGRSTPVSPAASLETGTTPAFRSVVVQTFRSAVRTVVMPTFRCATIAIAILIAGPVRAQEQTKWPSQERPPLGASFTVEALGALPSSASIFPLLTSVADVIGDRIDTGGLSAGSPARVGAHGSTWTQTTYRVGDADITNLSGVGTPLLMPGVDVWERVDVATGLMPTDVDAPAMSVTLTPRAPSATTLRAIELFGSPPFATAGSATDRPPSI